MPLSLQDRLDEITTRTRSLVQPDRLAISEAITAELFATGIEQRILPVGSPAPLFTLEDSQTGRPVALADLLALGPVILKFFRGRWDPYCVTELEAWRELYQACRINARAWRFNGSAGNRITALARTGDRCDQSPAWVSTAASRPGKRRSNSGWRRRLRCVVPAACV